MGLLFNGRDSIFRQTSDNWESQQEEYGMKRELVRAFTVLAVSARVAFNNSIGY
jgi:hypothetical protein